MDDRAERGGERERQPLVPARDARADVVRVRREAGQRRRLDLVGARRARHLEPGLDSLAGARVERERVEQRAGGGPGRDRRQPLGEQAQRLVEGGRVDADPTPRLPRPVAHPLLPEAEPEPLDEGADRVVTRENELGAELDDGAVRQLPRVNAAADPVARLEQHDLGARADERIGRGKAGQSGPDDGDPDPLPVHGRDRIALDATVRAQVESS